MRRPALVALLALAACSKSGGDAAGGAGADRPGTPPADPGGVRAEPGDGGATTVTECPKSLGGAESRIDRILSRECGAVLVAETYHIDDGSLTLEPGASLAFKDGATLVVGFNAPAKLVLKGTADAPVLLTSAGDKAPGAWGGVRLHARAERAVFEHAIVEYGGDAEHGAVYVDAAGATIQDTTIRHAPAAAVRIGAGGSLAAFARNTLTKLGDRIALVSGPAGLAGLGEGNKFDGGAVIHALGGTLAKSARLPRLGAPLLVTEEIAVDGAEGVRAILELAPGTELRFGAEGRLSVGHYEVGGLKAVGTADAPITFTADGGAGPGGWSGLRVGNRGDVALEHAVLEFGGKDTDLGVVHLQDGALAVAHTTFRSNRAGVTIAGDEGRVTAFTGNKFAATPVAVALAPALVGSLGEDNAYDGDARIVVATGPVKAKATWLAQGAPLELTGEVAVDGAELTLDAGLQVLARPEGVISVGGYEPASLLAHGTAAAPITIAAVPGGAGTWRGIKLLSRSRGNVLEHVQLTGVGEDPGVWADEAVDVRLDNVSCARCKTAVVGWQCGAKVSSSAVLATDGTPAIEAKPAGC